MAEIAKIAYQERLRNNDIIYSCGNCFFFIAVESFRRRKLLSMSAADKAKNN